ncbi:helix-turn-helix domain-containing protein [Pandoraea sp.]|uniref:helix-turn-helix domain-containing protein n=1 Tax=Pandoraea sp. TaxID=1883445 RepID=UPI0025D3B884|nr:helix-turn-helix domain-containing protein [Pandoraea sp.]
MSLEALASSPANPVTVAMSRRQIHHLHEVSDNTAALHCTSCLLRAICLPSGLSMQDAELLNTLISARRTIRRGHGLYHAGDPFENIYAVRAGSFKTQLFNPEGREQITGFQISGELLGLDGITGGRHDCDAIALEDSQVCVIPFKHLEQLSFDMPTIQHMVHRLLGAEISRERKLLMVLGNMCAEERVASFILDFSARLTARGYSSSEFNLRVTREEIGNYLGMKMETVSRIFSRFQDAGYIAMRQRLIRIVDLDGLRAVLEPARLSA